MNIKEIREMKNEALEAEIVTLKEELFNLRFERATGSIENPMRIREIRKTIARIKTVLTERSNVKEG
ncbi:MAG: 50S ribosomal protein L29 [Erysipelotrichaceae bacterium]|nr:50S ribosomal protein L29 [Erysipelotrichaceae bacterium]